MSKADQLKEKITEESQLRKIYGVPDRGLLTDYISYDATLWAGSGKRFDFARNTYPTYPAWWVFRESCRIRSGVYMVSEVLKSINCELGIGQHIVHVSRDDPKMVAYTASREDGERDKQTRTTIGRFLRKFCLNLTDAEVQRLEQEHHAEVSTELIWATEAADIRNVYENMDGDTGCMRRAPNYFNITNDIHPSEVYAAPGVAIAYTTTADGIIKSRSVTYTNPNDPTDKRYVRVYGSPVLKRLLKNQGYRLEGLHDVKLAKIPYISSTDPDDLLENHYLMPYLDGPDGDQDIGSWVVDEGDGYLTIVDRDKRDKIRAVVGDSYVPSAKSTSAYCYANPLPPANFTSLLSGKVYNIYTDSAARWYDHATHVLGKVARDDLRRVPYMEVRTVDTTGQAVSVYCSTDCPTFIQSGYRYTDNDTTRAHYGYRKLSSTYYPDQQTWASGNGLVEITQDGAVHVIKIADSLIALHADATALRCHKSVLGGLRERGYVNASPMETVPVVIHRDRPTLTRTDGGTVFCTMFHLTKFSQVVGGKWVTRDKAYTIRWAGTTLALPRGDDGDPDYGVLTQAMFIDGIRNTTYGASLVGIGDSLSIEGLTVEGVDATIKTLELYAFRTLEGIVGHTWYVNAGSDGKPKCGGVKYGQGNADDYFKQLDMILGDVEFGRHATTTKFGCVVGAVKTILDGFVAKLQAHKEQLVAEAAGQLRIDTPPVDTLLADIDAALAGPAVDPEDQLLADLGIPVPPTPVTQVPQVEVLSASPETQATISDERYALVA